MALHDAAIKDEYFVKRQLAPNVDFWYVTVIPYSAAAEIFVSISGGKLSSSLCLVSRNVIEDDLFNA
jgi:hypothetical protein